MTTGSTPDTASFAAFRALRHRNFRLFFFGQTTSLAGTWVQTVAQSWLVYRLTHSEVLLGAIGFFHHFPTLLLAPAAGAMADRADRRRLVILGQVLFLCQAVALATLTLTGHVTVAWVLALSAFQGLVDAFERPARQSMLIHLAGREDLINAISLNSLMYNLARIAGPALGGLMVAAVGEGVCFSLNAASFLAVLASLSLIRVPIQEPAAREGTALQHLKEGFQYLRQNRHAESLIGVMGTTNLAAAPLWALMPFFADSIFHKGSAGTGFLTASMGTGAVAGMLGLASRKSTEGLDSIVFSNAAGLALSMAAFALSPAYAFSMVAMAGVGYFLMRMNGASNTLVQSAVPENLRGRVMGLFAAANVGVIPIGSLGGGALAAMCGPRWVVGVAAILCAAAALMFHRRYRA